MSAYLAVMHEARHATAALALGFQVSEVTIAPDGQSGWCAWDAPAYADIEHVLLVVLAGLSGDEGEYRAHSDVKQAGARYARWMRQHGPAAPFEMRVQQWLQDCRYLLIPEATTVQTIGNALLEHGRLTSADLEALTGRSSRDSFSRTSAAPAVLARRSARPTVSPEQKREDAMVLAAMEALSGSTLDIMRRNRQRRLGRQ